MKVDVSWISYEAGKTESPVDDRENLPMDVVFTVVGQVVVDDHGNLLNVYTSSKKISGNEDAAGTCSKFFHDHFSFCLGHLTVLLGLERRWIAMVRYPIESFDDTAAVVSSVKMK